MHDFFQRIYNDPTWGRILFAAAGIIILFIINRFTKRSLLGNIKDNETKYKLKKSVSFASYIIGIVFISVVYSDKLSGITVALGVAGAGIAFALQEVITSVAGWLAVSIGRFYRSGDRVQLGGIKGDVIDIGILRTTLMECGEWVNGDLYSGRVVRVANSFVFKEPVFNYSGEFPFLWDEITLPVRYGCDHKFVKEVLHSLTVELLGDYANQAKTAWKELVRRYRIENASVEPMVTMFANDNWMEYTIRYVVDYKKRRSTKDALFSRIIDEVDKSDGKIMLASATFEIVPTSALKIESRRK